MSYGRPLTLDEWKRAVKTLERKRVAHLPTGETIIPWIGTYGTTYSLRNDEGGCIIETGNLNKIKELVIK